MLTKTFKQLSKSDVSIAGGKGASLGEMTRAKIPVPEGFVVLSFVFDKFLTENDLTIKIERIIKKVNYKNIDSVDMASKKIRNLIDGANISKDIAEAVSKEFFELNSEYVAVRSSATAEDSSAASWAGELESYLNVTKSSLLDSVKKCWSSLFTPRAIFYRFEKEMHDQKVSVAVVVQKMIQSEISGICFTVHPVTKDHDQMVIEAGYGLGEAIVGGIITPDTYIINKNLKHNFIIPDKNISEQKMMIVKNKNGTVEKIVPRTKQDEQKLSDEQIKELAKICFEIEKCYKKPQDIEWAFERNKFYIVQSRPITAL